MHQISLCTVALVISLAAQSMEARAAAQPTSAEGGRGPGPISVADLEARRAAAFARADGDGDGLVSPEEFEKIDVRPRRGGGAAPHGAFRRSEATAASEDMLFDALDANGDGAITRDEFSHDALASAHHTLRREHAFARLDENGDGALSPEEFPPGHLAQRDADGDGYISADEMPRGARSGGGPWEHRPGHSQP